MEIINVNSTYENNQEFNQQVDDDFGSLVISGAVFRPSRVLYEMEPETYNQALLEYKEQEAERLRDTIQDEFPTPIAYNFHRFEHGSENSNQRLEILRDTWEALIRLLFAIVVGEVTCAGLSMDEVNIDREYLFSDKLNNELVVIRKLIELVSKKDLSFSFLSILNIDIVDKLENLNQVRNLFSHTSALTEEQAREMIIDHLDEVLSIFRQLDRLSKVVLMHYIKQNGNAIVYESFEGYAINRDIREITITKEQLINYIQYFKDDCILVMIGEHFFNVSPFLHFIREGHHTKLCLYTKKEGKEPNRKFHYEIIAESRKKEIDETKFTEAMMRINTLVPTESRSKRFRNKK